MNKNQLGKIIKEIRLSKKWTQKDLSKKTGFSQNTISNHENGNRTIGNKELQIYADAFAMSFSDIQDKIEIKRNEQITVLKRKVIEHNQNRETNLKNKLLEVIQKDLSYLEVHYLNNMYNFYELEKEQNDNLLFISVLIQQLNQHKGSKDKEVYDDIIKDFDDFLKRYLEIK